MSKTVKINHVIDRLEEQNILRIDPGCQSIYVAGPGAWVLYAKYSSYMRLYKLIAREFAYLVLEDGERLGKKWTDLMEHY